jgi:diguanylate cyclase (GGDEF)-like protein
MRSHPLYAGAPPEWQGAIVGLPLKVRERVVGVMNISYPEPRIFEETDTRTLQLLADHAAIAIENAQLHEQVARQARTDALTGLPNRRALNERIAAEVARARRYGHSLALLMMDVDGFKAVNDSYGHPFGDHTLQQLAARLAQVTRHSDFLARYGGDEFALLLPEADLPLACEVAAKLCDLVHGYRLDIDKSNGFRMSLSVGIAVFPDNAASCKQLLELADQTLYDVKRNAPGTFAPKS